MGSKHWTEDFVIADVRTYMDNVTTDIYYGVQFLASNGDKFGIKIEPGTEKYENLVLASTGYENIANLDDIEMVGRIVKATLFENEDRLGRISFNLDYFKPAGNHYQADLFFQKYQEFWSDERKTDYENRCDYVDYLKETFNYDIHQSLIDQATANGQELDD